MCTKNELTIILNRLTETFRTVYAEQLVRVILYGSYARGDYTEESDIDVVALVSGERAEIQEKLKKVWDVSSDMELEFGTVLSPTVIPYAEYEKYRDDLPYYRIIAQEGVVISA